MGSDQHEQPPEERGHEQASAAQAENQPSNGSPSSEADNFDNIGNDLSFKKIFPAVGAALTLAFAALSAGYSPLRVTLILILALIACLSAMYAYRAYLALRRHEFNTRSLAWVSACTISTILMVAAFIYWPFDSNSVIGSNPHRPRAAPSSCDLNSLPTPPAVTKAMAASPLMYAIRSTDTVAGDKTAVAHEIFAHGWMQQVFIATRLQIADVSAVISLNLPSFKPFLIKFELRNSGGAVIGSASAHYDGSTNNTELHATFPKPISLKRGRVYALRVINESNLTVAMYTHVLNDDPALTAPYPVPVCAYDSADGGPKAIPILDNNGTYQVLSGAISAN
jgi:hypothetical protein